MYKNLIERLREYPDREETAGGYVEIDWQDLLDAADAIESLAAQFATLRAENAELQHDAEREHERYIETLGERDGLEASVTALGAALARVEAERDAAVKDMKLMADKAREEHGDDVPCFVCRFDGDMSVMPSGDFAEECPGFDREDCFEWRGAQGEG